ncbi:glycerophosphodiester phosphodiesterase [Leifsonia poae]|uniref:glycerophosphodiester phosphodiesterase n=1 Tax=Leifsonia poae TaxID=110933 RepID=UPI003D66C36F
MTDEAGEHGAGEHGAGEAPRHGESRRVLSRRALIGGAAGVLVIAAAGIATPFVVTQLTKSHGKLVKPLLESELFTVAHRGGSKDWPEMSLFAYRNSVDRGVDALEISLARTSDGVWFGLHDATLDRTSGTQGFVVADHTWAEVSEHRITAAETTDPKQPSRPYLRFETLVAEFGSTHAIFVDPKVVPATYFPELLRLMDRMKNPGQTFIAKGYCTSRTWAQFARDNGLKSWGYYYGSELDASPTLLSSTQGYWNLLGIDYEASDAAWASIRSPGKPVVGHIIPTRAAADIARSHGAAGLVISGITEVLG